MVKQTRLEKNCLRQGNHQRRHLYEKTIKLESRYFNARNIFKYIFFVERIDFRDSVLEPNY